MLDESGSISVGTGEAQVESAVTSFATTLRNNASGAGTMQMGIVEFSTSSAVAIPFKDVKDANFLTTVSDYLNGENTGHTPNYSPAGSTNYQSALTTVLGMGRIDIVFFLTDGDPDPTPAMNVWMDLANKIKCNGTYMFGIGVGSSINPLNIQALSGPDELGNPKGLINGADFTIATFSSLPQSLIDLANAEIDTKAPTLTCPAAITVNNTPGACGANVPFSASATDNCPNFTLTATPAAGSFFAVGQTVVTFKATDNVGNVSTCTFTVTVHDLEAPKISCPANKTISCEESTDPSNTGSPVALDNCSIAQITNIDQRFAGACPSEFSIGRTWTATDVHGNHSSCLQTIKGEDKKSPVIVCPASITVTCDTTTAKTGVATATDNCDAHPGISHTNQFVSGDCEWLCVTTRTWVARDNCGNMQSCVQTITKNTQPLIDQAIQDSLVFGVTNSTLTIRRGSGNCILGWLPNGGGTPVGLPGSKKQVVGTNCLPGTNALDGNGHLVNPLLAQAIKLAIIIRLNPAFGNRKLSTFSCTIDPIVRHAMKPDPDINELMRLTNITLGNNSELVVPAHLVALLNLLVCINGPLDVCKQP